MSFDQDGDAGTAVAMEDALAQVAEGDTQAVIDMLTNAPPGPVETKWGVGFRTYEECLEYIRANNMEAPEGGLALPLRYTVHELPSYTIVPSNALWHDPARADEAKAFRKYERDLGRPCLYFPQVMRDARRMAEYYPGLSPESPECMDELGVSLAHCESKCQNFYDAAEVERVFYPEIEKLLLEFFPGATDALVYNHDVFNKDYEGDRTEDQDNKIPGVNRGYANLVHNDLNDNSGRVRCRELLTKNLRNFGREQHYTQEEADAKMSRRFMSINLAKPMETVGQYPFVLCAWPSFADQPYITNYRIYDDRVGETTPLHLPARPRVVLVAPAEVHRGLDAQVLRLCDGRFRLALVLPHGLPGSNRARRRSVPQERRGQILRLLLGSQFPGPDPCFGAGRATESLSSWRGSDGRAAPALYLRWQPSLIASLMHRRRRKGAAHTYCYPTENGTAREGSFW